MTPRPPTVNADDALLNAAQCGRKVGGIHPENWPTYAARWPMLIAGLRIVRVTPGSKGRARWLRSAVVAHIVHELRRGEEARLPVAEAVQS